MTKTKTFRVTGYFFLYFVKRVTQQSTPITNSRVLIW